MKVKVAGATRHSKTSYSVPVSQRQSRYGSRLRFSRPHITIRPITAKLDVIYKTGSTPEVSQRRQMRTTGDLHTKFWEDLSSGSRDMLVDRHTDTLTDRQTDRNSLVSYRGEVKIV